jgi:hypothetical protein
MRLDSFVAILALLLALAVGKELCQDLPQCKWCEDGDGLTL